MGRTRSSSSTTGGHAVSDLAVARSGLRARWRALIALAAALCLVGLVTACGSADTGPMTADQAVPGEPMMDAEMGPGADARDLASVAQQVIKTATISIRVDDVASSGRRVVQLVAESKGFIEQQDLSNSGEAAYETITARVPADRLDAFVSGVSSLGSVEYLTSQASDVTQQVVDLDARINALRTSVQRLEELLAATTNVADLVAVETELANRQAELDSLVSQREYLGNQVAYSTVTVSISPVVESIGATPPGFWPGLQNGWTALITLAGAAVTALGFLLPFILITSAIAVPIIIAITAAGRRRRRGSGAGTD